MTCHTNAHQRKADCFRIILTRSIQKHGYRISYQKQARLPLAYTTSMDVLSGNWTWDERKRGYIRTKREQHIGTAEMKRESKYHQAYISTRFSLANFQE